MHTLHFILIKADREIDTEDAFCIAADTIESFQFSVFDCHEGGPGCWAEEYPEPISYRKSPEQFIFELNEIIERMKAERQSALDHLAKQFGLNDNTYPAAIGQALFSDTENLSPHTLWAATNYLRLLKGDYLPTSQFYDGINGSALIPVVDDVIMTPLGDRDDLYLVPMDLHF